MNYDEWINHQRGIYNIYDSSPLCNNCPFGYDYDCYDCTSIEDELEFLRCDLSDTEIEELKVVINSLFQSMPTRNEFASNEVEDMISQEN